MTKTPSIGGRDGEVSGTTDASGPVNKSVDARFQDRVRVTVPDRHNPKLQSLVAIANSDDDLYGLWLCSNVNAMDRLGMTDHGPVHVKIVMNIAVRMLRLLTDRGVQASVVTDWGMDHHDAELVVALASLLHDLGMSIHRTDHEAYSLVLADRKLGEILPQLYDPQAAPVIRSEVLHAIISHRSGSRPLTLEAGIVRIADALDMAKGRSRIPFETGSVSIHSVSAAAVETVRIEPGSEKPVRIAITLSNSAGVFQVDQLFRNKLTGSGLENLVEVEATIEGEAEKRLVASFRI